MTQRGEGGQDKAKAQVWGEMKQGQKWRKGMRIREQRRKSVIRILLLLCVFIFGWEIPNQDAKAAGGGTAYASSSNSSYIFADSDRRYLSQSEVNVLTLQAICYAKNEIYARHGRTFESQELTDYFSSKSWYCGTVLPEEFSPAVFNGYETANIDLLASTEEARQAGGYVLDQPGYDIYAVGGGSAGSARDSGYIFYDSDSRYLTDAEINSLSCQMACYAKNEIYARHGRIFESQELIDYFSSKSWYYGTVSSEEFSSDVFNKYETANIEALKNREFSLNSAGYQLY